MQFKPLILKKVYFSIETALIFFSSSIFFSVLTHHFMCFVALLCMLKGRLKLESTMMPSAVKLKIFLRHVCVMLVC